MNFLAGPITRTQIPALNKLVSADQLKGAPKSAGPGEQSAASSEVHDRCGRFPACYRCRNRTYPQVRNLNTHFT